MSRHSRESRLQNNGMWADCFRLYLFFSRSVPFKARFLFPGKDWWLYVAVATCIRLRRPHEKEDGTVGLYSSFRSEIADELEKPVDERVSKGVMVNGHNLQPFELHEEDHISDWQNARLMWELKGADLSFVRICQAPGTAFNLLGKMGPAYRFKYFWAL